MEWKNQKFCTFVGRDIDKWTSKFNVERLEQDSVISRKGNN